MADTYLPVIPVLMVARHEDLKLKAWVIYGDPISTNPTYKVIIEFLTNETSSFLILSQRMAMLSWLRKCQCGFLELLPEFVEEGHTFSRADSVKCN